MRTMHVLLWLVVSLSACDRSVDTVEPPSVETAAAAETIKAKTQASLSVIRAGHDYHSYANPREARIKHLDLDLTADFDLAIMKPGQTLYDVAHGCLDGLRDVARDFRPDLTLVQGDTATVFFASLVAFFEQTAVGHVEAGLRSHDKWAPFPEEVLRRLTGVITDVHFAPTVRAKANLLAEGVPGESIHVTGNTVVDALLRVARSESEIESPDAVRAVSHDGRLILLTAHRRESFGQPIREVFHAVRDLVDAHQHVQVLYPVHPNPNVLNPAREILGDHPRICLTEPIGYLDLVRVLQRADLVLTDSGGIQEEAPTFGTPVLVLREVTERPEGVDAGVAQLVGTDREKIVAAANSLLDMVGSPGAVAVHNPYGDGRAGERIADIIHARFTARGRYTQDWMPVSNG